MTRRRRFGKELEEGAVGLAQPGGSTRREIAGDLGMGCRDGSAGSAGAGRGALSTPRQHGARLRRLQRLRRENEILRREQDVLKQAPAGFAREGSR